MARPSNQFKPEAAKEQKKAEKREPKNKHHFLPKIFRDGRLMRIIGFFLLLLSVYLLLAIISYFYTWKTDSNFVQKAANALSESTAIHNWAGALGAVLANMFIYKGVGISAFVIVFILFLFGFRMLSGISLLPLFRTFNYSLLLMLWLSVTLGYFFRDDPDLSIFGGTFGFESSRWLIGMAGQPGTILLLAFILVGFLIFVGLFPVWMRRHDNKPSEAFAAEGDESQAGNVPPEDKYNTIEFAIKDEEDEEPVESVFTAEPQVPGKPGNGIELTIEPAINEKTGEESPGDYGGIDSFYDPTLELADYRYPTLDLLNDYHGEPASVNKEELEHNKDRIVETLNNYAIRIDKIKATIGPTVTLYEIIPAPGVRISKIKNLEDDIALSLSAMGIRIIAPIPGKGTIGIEVPNLRPEIVSIKSLLSSDKFRNCTYELPFALGKTIANESYIGDLTRMPHILMAGATGQGKSVGLNAIILSLLYKKHPSQVKFVLIDPKKVELTLFSKIERHFLARLPDSEESIITDTRQVVRTLNSLGIEMDHRYELLKEAQVRNIKEYNIKFIARRLNPNEGHKFLPYIVVIIDEFADLIMTAGREIENPLTRLAQLARATGIHLIIATQRPSVNIITGTIKANFPARIAYRVIAKVDSRTIMDSSGADQLVGKGDMLLSTGSDLMRLQCAFVDLPEVDKVTDFIGSQRGYADAFNLPEYYDESDEGAKDFDPNERDELFEDAARLIVMHQQGSTSLLQRKLKLGYNRAGRIIDQLEAAGIVGHFEGSKARDVLIANEMVLEQFLKDLNSKQE